VTVIVASQTGGAKEKSGVQHHPPLALE